MNLFKLLIILALILSLKTSAASYPEYLVKTIPVGSQLIIDGMDNETVWQSATHNTTEFGQLVFSLSQISVVRQIASATGAHQNSYTIQTAKFPFTLHIQSQGNHFTGNYSIDGRLISKSGITKARLNP